MADFIEFTEAVERVGIAMHGGAWRRRYSSAEGWGQVVYQFLPRPGHDDWDAPVRTWDFERDRGLGGEHDAPKGAAPVEAEIEALRMVWGAVRELYLRLGNATEHPIEERNGERSKPVHAADLEVLHARWWRDAAWCGRGRGTLMSGYPVIWVRACHAPEPDRRPATSERDRLAQGCIEAMPYHHQPHAWTVLGRPKLRGRNLDALAAENHPERVRLTEGSDGQPYRLELLSPDGWQIFENPGRLRTMVRTKLREAGLLPKASKSVP